MSALFEDLPEAIASTSEIARRCAFRVKKRNPILPQFDTKAGRDEPAELKAQARSRPQGAPQSAGRRRARGHGSEYRERLAYELKVITQMKFPGYFLIVADFIKWAKQHGIPVGPGRGSGAGSVVAWALTITDLDPLRFGLLFERFLNPERVSMPDFDIDFCQERRGEVIDYVKNKYGADRVAQIITFGTLQARAVLRDVGRVMQLPFGQVDRLAKLVPANPANPVTLEQALEIEPRFKEAREREPEVGELLDVSLQLEGLYRNASTHAAGIVIGERPLVELVALYQDPRSDIPATQFNMKWVEAAGLVKFDFLGLKTLTVIDRALKFLRKRGVDLDLAKLPLDDPKTYELMQSGLTFGVFQLEGQGMRDTLRKVKPTSLEDIIALISLYRPGPMKNIDLFATVKSGQERLKAARASNASVDDIADIEQNITHPDYLHPTLEPILSETYGVIVYQEQVMQIAQVLSGYSLGEADLLRRAMGKKQPAEMAKQKTRFIEGAKERGVSENKAAHIFDLVEEFAGYGFNKSHAAAYAVVAFQTGYLKAHYPVEFIAASMSLDLSNSDKLASFHQDARRMSVPVLPPDLNASEGDFSVEKTGEDALAIRYALGAVRNVGLAAMDTIVAERTRGGKFKSLHDFAERLDAKTVNRRQLENLAKAGAFDTMEPDRARAHAACEILAAYAQRVAEERASAQASLFGAEEPSARPAFPKPPAWSGQDRLDAERESVGFYLSGHPLSNFYADAGERYRSFAEILEEGETEPRVYAMAGVVRRVQYRPAMWRHARLHLALRSHRRLRSHGDAGRCRVGARSSRSRQAFRLSCARPLARRRLEAFGEHLRADRSRGSPQRRGFESGAEGGRADPSARANPDRAAAAASRRSARAPPRAAPQRRSRDRTQSRQPRARRPRRARRHQGRQGRRARRLAPLRRCAGWRCRLEVLASFHAGIAQSVLDKARRPLAGDSRARAEGRAARRLHGAHRRVPALRRALHVRQRARTRRELPGRPGSARRSRPPRSDQA